MRTWADGLRLHEPAAGAVGGAPWAGHRAAARPAGRSTSRWTTDGSSGFCPGCASPASCKTERQPVVALATQTVGGKTGIVAVMPRTQRRQSSLSYSRLRARTGPGCPGGAGIPGREGAEHLRRENGVGEPGGVVGGVVGTGAGRTPGSRGFSPRACESSQGARRRHRAGGVPRKAERLAGFLGARVSFLPGRPPPRAMASR